MKNTQAIDRTNPSKGERCRKNHHRAKRPATIETSMAIAAVVRWNPACAEFARIVWMKGRCEEGTDRQLRQARDGGDAFPSTVVSEQAPNCNCEIDDREGVDQDERRHDAASSEVPAEFPTCDSQPDQRRASGKSAIATLWPASP